MQTMFTPTVIHNKRTTKVKSNVKGPTNKWVCAFCISVEYKIKRKFTFFSANTKYISSSAVKISAFSLMLLTHEKYWFFHRTRWNFWYSPQKGKYPLFSQLVNWPFWCISIKWNISNVWYCTMLCNSYTKGCPPVHGDNPQALASGLSYIHWVHTGGQTWYNYYISPASVKTLHIPRYFMLKLARMV